MKITVGIPIYNQKPKYFRECLESIKAQSYQSFECIILDDGSSNREEVEKITEEYGFKYIYQKNSGIGAARQAIVDNASKETDYITFLSSDDIWEPNFLEVMRKTTIKHQEKILYSNYYMTDGENNIINKTGFRGYKDHQDFCLACLESANKNTMFVNFSTTFFPKEIFEKVPFNKNLRFGEDLDFLLKSMKHFEYYFVKDYLLKYRAVDNTTSRIRHKIGENNEKILKEVREYWESG